MRVLFLYGGLIGGLVLAATTAPAAQYVATPEIVVQFRATDATPITSAELWLSTDNGRSWRKTDAERSGTTLRCAAQSDGRYDFFVILRNEAGASSEPPTAGTRPTATVIVDRTPPLLQLHDARIEAGTEGRPRLLLRSSLIEENLSETGLRRFYRRPDDKDRTWRDGGSVARADDELSWPLPPLEVRALDIRVVATDLAGNAAASELRDVTIPDPGRAPTEKAAPAPIDDPNEAMLVEHVEPVGVKPGAERAAPARDKPAATRPAAPPSTEDARQIVRLRSAATRLLGEGRYSLAAARFEEALQLNPHDSDLLTDLGSTLYRLGQYDDANQRFSAAVKIRPDHAGAVEGLALVAATQKRYPDAREHLQHLLRLTPDSSTDWLRYGDVEHRLGNTVQARAAWEHVLEMPTADKDLREKAQRRLEYFRADGAAATAKANSDGKGSSNSSDHRDLR